MGNSIATVTGTALVPGVSKNRRLYSPELIGKAVARAQQRITEGGPPLTMRISHPEQGKEHLAPVTEIVGRITKIWQEPDGRAKFTAAIADTPHGRTVAALVDNRDGDPYLKNVSIRGGFLGRVHKVVAPSGEMAETADDLELDGADYTHKPGVAGAEIEQVTDPDESARESGIDGRTPIIESVEEALVTAIDEASAPAKAEQSGGPFADPGYQKDGQKRYPIDSKAHAKAAWAYLSKPDNARLYSANQLKRIKGRIKAALGKFGVTVAAQEGWLIDRVGAVSESVAEAFGMDGDQAGSFSICLTNGPITVNISSYCLDPHDLDVIGRAAMGAACDALAVMDPDLDGDIDIAGAPAEDDDNDAPEAAPAAAEPVVEAEPEPTPVAPDAPTTTETPAPQPAAGSTTEPESEDPAMAETTPAAEGTTAATPAPVAGITFTDDQFQQFLARMAPVAAVAAPAEAAPAETAPVAETTTTPEPAPVAETEEQRIARIVEAQVTARLTAAIQESVEKQGPPQRKGLVGRVTESGELATTGSGDGELNEHGLPANWPNKPLHQYTSEERARYMSPTLMQHVVGHRI